MRKLQSRARAVLLSQEVKPVKRITNRPRYGIINLTSNVEPYIHFDQIKENYYRNYGVPYLKILNEPTPRLLADNELLYISGCVHSSGIPVMLEKFIWAIQKIQYMDVWKDLDFIVRTNASTFLNVKLLEKYLAALPKKRCYAGYIINKRFISGTCIVFSKDVVEKLAQSNVSEFLDCYDDIALSILADRMHLRMRSIPMVHYTNNSENQFKTIITDLKKYPLIRIKNDKDRLYYDNKLWDIISQNISVNSASKQNS